MKKKYIFAFALFLAVCLILFSEISTAPEETQETRETEKVAEKVQETQEIQTSANILEPLTYDIDTDWNLLTETTLIREHFLDPQTGKMDMGKAHCIAPFLPVEADKTCILYFPMEEIQVLFYDAKKQFIDAKTVCEAAEVFLELPKNCLYVSISASDEAMKKGLVMQERQDAKAAAVLAVSANGAVGNSIAAAASALDEGVIVIFPGTYTEQVKAWGKKIDFYGVDRDSCILESTSSSYYAPPLEIGAGSVTNLTIRAVDRNSTDSALYAYGVHVEDHFLYGNTLRFENCVISSDFNSAVGIGLRGGCKVEFVDTVLTGKETGLFCHDSAYQKYTGLQEISLIRCTITGLEGKAALRFDSQGVTGAQIQVTFIGNTLLNPAAASTQELLETRNNHGAGSDDNWMGLKNYEIMCDSCGNNVETMNYNYK
jgi:hypothetical protein